MQFKPGLLTDRDLTRYRLPTFNAALDSKAPIPDHIDRRWEMLPTSNQGLAPKCAGYAMAGVIEWYNWKYRAVYEQVDPNHIYSVAKELDGSPNEDGTTLEAVAQAAAKLDLIPIDLSTLKVVYAADAFRALHQYGVLLSGFYITSGWQKATPDGWIEDGGGYLGGHAVVLIGRSTVETPNWVGIQNSWGDSTYGWRGFCRMTPEQFKNEFLYGLTWEYKV